MGEIIIFLIALIGIAIIIYLAYRAIRKSNSLAEIIGEIIIAVVIATFLLVYYLDRCNIPTKLNWNVNVNTQNWLSFIGNYITGIVSAIIGSLVAVWAALYQTRKNNEDNIKINSENLRIQNMPLLKYDFETFEGKLTPDADVIMTKFKEGKPYKIGMSIKNIGLSSIKNIKVDFISEINDNKKIRLKGKDTVIVMESNEKIEIRRIITLDVLNKPYIMNLEVSYQDVLNNWYKQIIEIYYTATDVVNVGGPVGKIEWIVKEEERIENYELVDDIK